MFFFTETYTQPKIKYFDKENMSSTTAVEYFKVPPNDVV